MLVDYVVRIAGINKPLNGVEVRDLFLDNIVKPNSLYKCWYCGIELTEVNVEKDRYAIFVKKSHFRLKVKGSSHSESCEFFKINTYVDTEKKDKKQKDHNNDGYPVKFIVPHINVDTLEVYEGISLSSSKLGGTISIEDKNNNVKLKEREVISSSNKIIDFATQFDEMNFCSGTYDKLYKNCQKILYFGTQRAEWENTFWNYFKLIETFTSKKLLELPNYPRIYWNFISNECVKFDDRYEFNIESKTESKLKIVLIIYKEHITYPSNFMKKYAYLYTIPKIIDGVMYLRSLRDDLICFKYYRPYPYKEHYRKNILNKKVGKSETKFI